MSSVISQSHSFESFLWAATIAGSKALAGAACGAVFSLPSAVRRLALIGAVIGAAVLADLALIVAGFGRALLICGAVAGAGWLVALLLAHPPIVLALLVIVAYGWATYPRSKAVQK